MCVEIGVGPAVVAPVAPGLHLPTNSRLIGGSLPLTREAVFLDRDGVIVKDVHYLRSLNQLELLPHVGSLLHHLRERLYVIVVTNQSGIARGLFTEQELLAIHIELVRRLNEADAVVDAFYYCPHLPTSSITAYRADCDCRKPKPGLLLRAAADWGIDLRRSYMIGDSPRDVEAGAAAGLAQSILIGGSAGPNFGDAVQFILGHGR